MLLYIRSPNKVLIYTCQKHVVVFNCTIFQMHVVVQLLVSHAVFRCMLWESSSVLYICMFGSPLISRTSVPQLTQTLVLSAGWHKINDVLIS